MHLRTHESKPERRVGPEARLVARALLCALAVASSLAPARAAETSNAVVVSHVSIVDVAAGRILPDRTVVVGADGKIASATPATRALRTPRGARAVDGRGLFLMPGLFDCHVHLNNPDRESRMLVANGVTFARDMGGATAERVALRERARRGELFGLELAVVGTILDGDPPYHPWSQACGTPERGREAVRAMKAAGVDAIKVYSLLKPEVHRAICDEARALGLKVVGHVPDSMTLDEAVADGQTGVEHLSRFESLLAGLVPDFRPAPGEFAGGAWRRYAEIDKERLRERLRTTARAAQCPTLVLHAGHARILGAQTRELWKQYATPDDREGWATVPPQYADYSRSLVDAFPYLQRTVRDLSEAKVDLIVGTDLANPGILAGFSVHEEMRLWQAAGIAPADVLRAATTVPARVLGVDNRLGAVEPGKVASLVLLRRNPLDDVKNAGEIEAVFAGGRYFARADLDALLAEAREDVLARSPAEGVKLSLAVAVETVARGRYDLFYEQYPDGSESFAIGRDATGYAFAGVRVQRGFGRFPTLVTGRWDLAANALSASLRPSVLLPTVEDYRVERSRFVGGAVRSGKPFGVATDTAFPAGSAVRFPLVASDYFFFRRLNLRAGESAEADTLVLGDPGWKPTRRRVTVRRLPDEQLTLEPDRIVSCARYELRPADAPDARADVWVDSVSGVPVKQVTKEGGATRSAVLARPAA